MPGLIGGESGVIERLDAAVEIARAGGRSTMEFFGSRTLGVEAKGDGTPVSEADRACEVLIRERLAGLFPDDGVLGEEFGDSPGVSGYRWIIDPIDGTFSFINGVPLFTTLIGIEHAGGARCGCVAGVVYAPALDEMVYARVGGGAWHVVGGASPTRARVSGTAALAGATVSTTSLDYWDETNRGLWLRIHDRAAHTRGWPDAYGVILAATGRCDGVVEPSLHCWDIAPFGPIMAEAGGLSTDWGGVQTPHASAVVVSNGLIHGELLGLISDSVL